MPAEVLLMRGINVGGAYEDGWKRLGFSNVTTYIASGNVILESDKRAAEIEVRIEKES